MERARDAPERSEPQEDGRPPAGPADRGPHFDSVDGLRAVAALSVVVFHVGLVGTFTFRSDLGPYLARADVGVSVFFVVSGFLLARPFIAAHLAGAAAPTLGGYLRRRALRILPAYWLALACAHLLLGHGRLDDAGAVLANLALVQVYWDRYAFTGIGPAWSLCAEAAFYLFLPLYAGVLGVAGRRMGPGGRVRLELAGVAALYGVGFAYRAWAGSVGGPRAGTLLLWMPSNLDAFALGLLLAVASAWWAAGGRRPVVLEHRFTAAACWVVAVVAYWAVATRLGLPRLGGAPDVGTDLQRQFLYGAVAFFVVLPAIVARDGSGVHRVLRWRPVVLLGIVSYGIYLWHTVWLDQIVEWTDARIVGAVLRLPDGRAVPFPALLAGVAALSVAAAAVSWVSLEERAVRLGRRPSRRRGSRLVQDGDRPAVVGSDGAKRA